MKETDQPFIVEFPLRGEWMAPNTPGTKIPSHGTDRFGSGYAFDFLQVDWNRKGRPSYRVHWLHYLLFGVPLNKCYCWGQEVYAPCDGVVIKASDGCPERAPVHFLSDLSAAVKNTKSSQTPVPDIQSIAGNYIILKCSADVFAGFVHLQKDSLRVSEGQEIQKGDLIGKIGHSGNSFFPHLHFQIMDSSDILSAKGLPCAFEEYELFKEGQWQTVYHGIPTNRDRIRFRPDSFKLL